MVFHFALKINGGKKNVKQKKTCASQAKKRGEACYTFQNKTRQNAGD